MRAAKRNPTPAVTLRLVPSPRHPEVQYRRHRRPLAERIAEAGNSLATLEDAADWRELSLMVFGDGRLEPVPTTRRDDKPKRDSDSQREFAGQIQAVRLTEERRGKR
jgi:hypothetical protein